MSVGDIGTWVQNILAIRVAQSGMGAVLGIRIYSVGIEVRTGDTVSGNQWTLELW